MNAITWLIFCPRRSVAIARFLDEKDARDYADSYNDGGDPKDDLEVIPSENELIPGPRWTEYTGNKPLIGQRYNY